MVFLLAMASLLVPRLVCAQPLQLISFFGQKVDDGGDSILQAVFLTSMQAPVSVVLLGLAFSILGFVLWRALR